MSTTEVQVQPGIPKVSISRFQEFAHESVLECQAVLCREDAGFSAHCANLRGVISQGESEEEAIDNIADAFRETVLYYRSANESIPWGPVSVDRPQGSREVRVLVRI